MNDLANFGDSVPWGQGHNLPDKYARNVAKSLGLQLRMVAHSGATIGIDTPCKGATDGEVPFSCPTVLQQVRNYKTDPSAADVVLVNGGINDVSVRNIINPLVPADEIRRLTRQYCRFQMAKLLAEVLREFSQPAIRVVVTSYFPIFSKDSNFDDIADYLRGNLVVVPEVKSQAALRLSILGRVVENAQAFWTESTAALKAAIADVGSPRIQFAEVPFQDDNAMFAHNSWLWEVKLQGGKLVPQDPVAAQRKKACDKFHPDPLSRSTCYIASAGHPNLKGSKAFADAILSIL
jgi:lysophospholipase L1-like esterase